MVKLVELCKYPKLHKMRVNSQMSPNKEAEEGLGGPIAIGLWRKKKERDNKCKEQTAMNLATFG